MAERTKHIHAQRSFRFLAERHKTLADGTLAKRPVTVSETIRRQNDRSPLAKRLVCETTGHRQRNDSYAKRPVTVSEMTRRRNDRSPLAKRPVTRQRFRDATTGFRSKCPRYLSECPCRFVNSNYFIYFSVKRFNNKPRNRRSRKRRKARKDTTLMTLMRMRESKNL